MRVEYKSSALHDLKRIPQGDRDTIVSAVTAYPDTGRGDARACHLRHYGRRGADSPRPATFRAHLSLRPPTAWVERCRDAVRKHLARERQKRLERLNAQRFTRPPRE